MPARERVGRRVRDWVPRWWRGEAGVMGRGADLALWPAELLFRTVVAARNRSYDLRLRRAEVAPIAVISIGNIGVGGAGKTPFAAWVASRLVGWGGRPGLALSGYGPDEILVHEEINPEVPVFTARRRIDAVRQAARSGCDVAVLDDAFQHRALARDLDIVLVAADGWGKAIRLLPRGPWREGLSALSRADLVVITRKAAGESIAREIEALIAKRIGSERLARCRLSVGDMVGLRGGRAGEASPGSRGNPLSGRQVLAVTSLADPLPFVAQLAEKGADVELVAFPDHHRFTAAEAAELARRAGARPLVMTRKEAVKLRTLLPASAEALLVEQQVVIESGATVLDARLRTAWRR